ncbi:MAG TPA: glycosyltransferase [Solirubrobacteraceae bacterium]
MTPSVGAVVLTQGNRPRELRRAVESLLAQRDVALDVLVVGNAWEPAGLPDGARALALAENVGAAAGRNAGVPQVAGELLMFLDDDASLPEPGTLARVAGQFAADLSLGLLQLRVDPADGGPPPREWVPRLRVGDRTRSGEVTAVWEGAVAARRAAFEAAGGWPAGFGIVHEGIDLAWRVMDAGYRVRYAGDLVALHPARKDPGRDYPTYLGARNKVWIARRHLPLPLAALYVGAWLVRTLPRLRSRRNRADALRGYRDGLRADCGPRRPLHARTLWRMLRLGRPPIL